MRKWNENRFFMEGLRPKLGGRFSIEDKEQIKHITGSLRLGLEDCLELCFSDRLECIGKIVEVSPHSVYLENIENCVIARELPCEIDLYQGVPKLKKIDLVVQKAVECGVHGIYPVNMNNCVANIKEEKKDRKKDRLQKIACSAAEQSKRLYVPRVNNPIESKDLVSMVKNYDLVILADEDLSIVEENQSPQTLKKLEKKIRKATKIAIIVGPEGATPQGERDMLRDLSYSVSLGTRILRTETAAMFMLAQLSYILN